ncbi:hypothetical protein R1flu_002833 [Riccia fluitans]|uniref:GH3 auxin-responsive promoter n=1 Tax=Riccia fluitans TaxID=41844 RepID=A0ABD1Y785_9MARC
MKVKEALLLKKTEGRRITKVEESDDSKLAMLFEKWRESERNYLQYLEEVTSDPRGEQEKLLEHILRKNASTHYLQQFRLNGATDVNTFRQLMPVSDYDSICPFIERIAEGDKAPLLSADPVTELLPSSGTTGGVSKLFPVTEEDKNLRFLIWSMSRPVLNKYLPGLEQGKCTFFYFALPGWKTKGGVLRQSAVTSFVLSRNFRQRPFDPTYRLTSPDEVILSQNHEESTYCHLLCALLQREEVLRLGDIYASGLMRAIQNLIDWWPEICEDVAKGTLSESKVHNSTAVREAVQPYLRADPELAEFIRQECLKKSWGGIIRRLWPNCKVVDTVCTGPMAAYIPILNHYSDNLPLICSQLYAASEGYFGLNLNPTCLPGEICYTLLPTIAYYEFIPISTEADDAETILDLSSLQESQEYELLVTTVSGLCRFRIGDVLKVVGFYNATPIFQFVRRIKALLTVDTDKTDEIDLLRAVNTAAKLLQDKLRLRLQDFTSTVDVSTAPPHYVFFLELRNDEQSVEGNIPAELLEECCTLGELSLSAIYRRNRAHKRIGSLELRMVRKGTFDRLAQLAFGRGCTPAQYKTVRALDPKQSAQLEILADGLVQQYTCKSCPPLPLSYADASILAS